MTFNRRETLALAGALSVLSLCSLGPAHAGDGDVIDQAKLLEPAGGIPDKVLGTPDAPVTVIEYASPTCPHCATFHNVVYEPFKAQYIDTGKVKYVLRPFVRNPLDAAIFMLAEAAGEANYHNVLATYFRTQNVWGLSDKPLDALLDVAKQLGFTKESFDAALTDQKVFDGISAMRDQALDEFRLEGTPTFYINGETFSGDQSLEHLAAAIDALVPADFKPTKTSTETPMGDDAMTTESMTTESMTTESMAPAAEAMEPATP